MNKRFKELIAKTQTDIDKSNKYLANNNEKINALNNIISRLKETQNALDDRFDATHKSIVSSNNKDSLLIHYKHIYRRI